MSQVCEGCGKKPSVGHNVSHSNRKTKRRFLPNLFKTVIDAGKKGEPAVIAKICTQCMRTMSKYAEKFGAGLKSLQAIQRKHSKKG